MNLDPLGIVLLTNRGMSPAMDDMRDRSGNNADAGGARDAAAQGAVAGATGKNPDGSALAPAPVEGITKEK